MMTNGRSQGGYDINRLYLNQHGQHFIDVAQPFGLALQTDSRNLVAADLDNDGRLDLVVTSINGMLSNRQKLMVFKNNLSASGNWIQIDFRDEPGHRSPIGASAILKNGDRQNMEVNVTGDSFRSQRPNSIRFGLGSVEKVDEVEIRWPGGAITRLTGPQINRTHRVSAPIR